MIIGIGVDVVLVTRFKQQLTKAPALRDRLFTPAERELNTRSLAARFAAKEAASKAFGTGLGAELSLTSVGVLNGPEGEPIVELDDKARALLAARGASRLLISLTHTDTLAQAFVVLVR